MDGIPEYEPSMDAKQLAGALDLNAHIKWPMIIDEWAQDHAIAYLAWASARPVPIAEKGLRDLCDEYFTNPMIQKYAGDNYTCMFCGAIEKRDGKATHTDTCPVIRYAALLAYEAPKEQA